MFRRTSTSRHRSEPTPSNSPPSSPTSPAHAFYLHPSGSRFTEDSVSAIWRSETGSDTTSSSIPSVRSTGTRSHTQSPKPQKLRRAPPPPARPLPLGNVDETVVDGSESESTNDTWTIASTPSLAASPAPVPLNRISFSPTARPAESFTEYDRLQVRSEETPSLVLLRAVAPEQSQLCGELLQTCLSSNRDAMRDIIPLRNGFVDTVIEAHTNHRGLIVRPDDVWLAIVTQFSFFVNGHAEALRKVFVAQEGKRELAVQSGGNRYTMNTASLAHRIMALMEQRVTDAALREWIMPNFTTTNEVDKMTCAIVMMGMMKDQNLAYKFTLRYGIPKVTLVGEKKDWNTILLRLEHLKKYGIQTIAWYHLLRPILSRFVNAYDHPTHPDNLDFWNKIAQPGSGSGSQWLSGWITAFCVFNERGQWQGNTLNEERIREHEPKKLLRPADPLQLTPSQFAAVYTVRERAPYLALDGFPYPTIESQDVPCGYVCLDMTLDDSGEVIRTVMIAGSVGAQICSTQKTELFRNGLRDTVRPVSAWWYLIKRKVVRIEEDKTNKED